MLQCTALAVPDDLEAHSCWLSTEVCARNVIEANKLYHGCAKRGGLDHRAGFRSILSHGRV